MRKRWAAVLTVGSIAFVTLLFWLTMRWSLVVLLAVSLPLFLLAWLKPIRLARTSAFVCVSALIIASMPADVRLTRSGHASIEVKPIFWGLPTEQTMAEIEPGSVVWGGCIVPWNAARYAILVSW